MGKLGYRKREPNEPKKEYPKLLRQMIAYHSEKARLHDTEIWLDFLLLKVSEFQEMYRAEV